MNVLENTSFLRIQLLLALCFASTTVTQAQEGFRLIDPPYFMESRTSSARIAWSPEAVAVMQGAKGFCVTTDGGDSWSKWHLFGKGIEDVYIISPSEFLVLYLDYVWGSDRASILAHTTDAGETWETIDTLSTWNSSIIATHDSVVVHIGTKGFTYNSATQVLSELPAEFPSSGNMVRDRDGNLYAGYTGIYRSSDEGKTWENIWDPRMYMYVYQLALSAESIYFECYGGSAGMEVLRYDFADGTIDTILYEPYRNRTYGTLVHNPYTETSYLIGSQLLEYDKGSRSYVLASIEFPVPYTVPSTMLIDSTRLWHIITNDGRYYTLQDGETEPVLRSDIFRSFIGNSEQTNPLFIHSSGDSLALFYQNNMYLSSDDGLSWGLASSAVSRVTTACWTNYGEIQFASPGAFHEFHPGSGNVRTYSHFAYSDVHCEPKFNRILAWNNASYSGEVVEMYSNTIVIRTLQVPGNYIRSAEMLDEQTFLVISDSGTNYREEAHIFIGDGTLNNWQEISPSTGERDFYIRSDAYGNIYAWYPRHLEKSTDRGNSWESLLTTTDEFLYFTHMFDVNNNGDLVILAQPARNRYVPINPGLHIYNNATKKWAFLPLNMEFVRPISIDLTDDGYVYLLTDHGLMKSEHDMVTSVNQLGIAGLVFELHQNYPNPFNPSTAISFAISKPGNAELNVYDLHGRVVEQHNLNGLQPGSHTIHLDMSGLPAGMYVYSLVADGETQSRKMLLVK